MLGFGQPTPAMAQQISSSTIEFGSTTAELIIDAYAVKEGILADPLVKTLACESGLRADAKGDFSTTTNTYTSFGVAQIHLVAHPDITKEEALDPFFAIGWAAHQFKLGNQHLWTCARELGY